MVKVNYQEAWERNGYILLREFVDPRMCRISAHWQTMGMLK